MVRSGFFKKPKSLIPWGSSKSIKIATRSPALGLNRVFNRRERLNGGKVSGTVSFVWAIIGQNFVLAPRLVKESIRQKRVGGRSVGVAAGGKDEAPEPFFGLHRPGKKK